MQTSANTKAKEFCKTYGLSTSLQEELSKLLLEHERDTRYTAIDILQQEDVEFYSMRDALISKRDAIQKIHGLKVG